MQRKTSLQKPRKYSSIPADKELREVDENGEAQEKESSKETVVQLNHAFAQPGNHNVTLEPSKHQVDSEDDDESRNSLRRFVEVWVAEVVGTGLLMCLGCMGGISGFYLQGGYHPAISAASFGMVVATIIQMFGHISAAHLNPCVSVCFYILGDISLPMLGNYFFAEAVGAVLGFGLLKAITPSDLLDLQPELCCTQLHPSVNLFQALVIEFVGTGVLVLIVCACSDPANATKQDSAPIKFGIYVTVISLAAGPYTGASINPTRSLAPAFWNGYWRDQWVYWMAPLSASVVFPILYQMIFWRGERPRRLRKISKKMVVTKVK